MHPLDLLKVKFQVSTTSSPSFTFSGISGAETTVGSPKIGVGKKIYYALREIKAQDGWRGLYRGIGPNIVGNASSWGLYFLLCVYKSDPAAVL
jgi:solute carrier family 25 (mitochondrial folate transporter), member 32